MFYLKVTSTERWFNRPCYMGQSVGQSINLMFKRCIDMEMRILTWMCRHTRKDKIRNEVIQEKVGVASIADKMKEARLR